MSDSSDLMSCQVNRRRQCQLQQCRRTFFFGQKHSSSRLRGGCLVGADAASDGQWQPAVGSGVRPPYGRLRPQHHYADHSVAYLSCSGVLMLEVFFETWGQQSGTTSPPPGGLPLGGGELRGTQTLRCDRQSPPKKTTSKKKKKKTNFQKKANPFPILSKKTE